MYCETATPSPINWYGYTKAVTEEMILKSGANAAILRSVIAYHPQDNGKTLFGWMASKVKKGEPIQAVYDLYFAPTYTFDIIDVIQLITSKKTPGIYHVDSKQELTPFDFANFIRLAYNTNVPVNGIRAIDFFGAERSKLRLQHASLDCKDSQKKLGFSARSVDQVLESLGI